MSLIYYNEAYPGALDSSANNMSTCLRPGRRIQLVSIQDTHIKGSPPTSSHYIVSPEATPLSLDSGFRRNDE